MADPEAIKAAIPEVVKAIVPGAVRATVPEEEVVEKAAVKAPINNSFPNNQRLILYLSTHLSKQSSQFSLLCSLAE